MSRFALLTLLLGLTLPVAAEFHDPTRPPAGYRAAPKASAAAPAASRFDVSFIARNAERRVARINGQWVGEGDRVGGAEVLGIGANSVRLRLGERVVDIPVASGRVDKRPATATGDKQ